MNIGQLQSRMFFYRIGRLARAGRPKLYRLLNGFDYIDDFNNDFHKNKSVTYIFYDFVNSNFFIFSFLIFWFLLSWSIQNNFTIIKIENITISILDYFCHRLFPFQDIEWINEIFWTFLYLFRELEIGLDLAYATLQELGE